MGIGKEIGRIPWTLAVAAFCLFFGCEGSSVITENDDLPDASINDDLSVTPQCGNGIVETGESCELYESRDCIDLDPKYYARGTATCTPDCAGWDLSRCVLNHIERPDCGNDIVEDGEECESGDIEYCTVIDPERYATGTAFCVDCVWRMDNCWKKNVCGNNIVEKEIGEICDKQSTLSCISLDPEKYIGGTAYCNNQCTGWLTYQCIEPNVCGNNILEEDIGEICEEGYGKPCVVLDPESYIGGTAYCDDKCTGWDPDTCVLAGICGNYVVENDEVCDESSLLCADISDQYSAGYAHCLNDCSGWNTMNCIEKPPCGNGVLDQNEECDASMTIPCVEIDPVKYTAGISYCNGDCTGWDISTCEE